MGRLAQKVISKHSFLNTEFREFRLARPDFEDDVMKLRGSLGISPEILICDTPEHKDAFNNYYADGRIDVGVRSLLKKFNLPKSWFEVAYFYVLCNNLMNGENVDKENSRGVILEHHNGGLENAEIILRIGRDSTFEDLKDAWKEITKIWGKGDVRNKKRGNLLRNVDIFRLHRKQYTLSQICIEIEQLYEGELSEDNIRKIIRETYQRYKTPVKYRLKIKTK